jgi:uncharacterized small protein (DUF1192 family)
MDWDEARPAPSKAASIGDNLEALSVAELESRMAAFAAEIERVEAELSRKRAHEAAASALFRKPGD